MERTIYEKVRGISFVLGENYPLVVANIKPGDELKLVHDKANKSHKYAVAVYHKLGKLGYLSKALAEDLVFKLNKCRAEVVKITGKNYGINIAIHIQTVPEVAQIPRGLPRNAGTSS